MKRWLMLTLIALLVMVVFGTVQATVLQNTSAVNTTYNTTRFTLQPLNHSPIWLTPKAVISKSNSSSLPNSTNLIIQTNITQLFAHKGITILKLVPLYTISAQPQSVAFFYSNDTLICVTPRNYWYWSYLWQLHSVYPPSVVYLKSNKVLIFYGKAYSINLYSGSIISRVDSTHNITIAKVVGNGSIITIQKLPYTTATTVSGVANTNGKEIVYGTGPMDICVNGDTIVVDTNRGLALFHIVNLPNGSIIVESKDTLVWNGSAFIHEINKNPLGHPYLLLEGIYGRPIIHLGGDKYLVNDNVVYDFSPANIQYAVSQNNVSLLISKKIYIRNRLIGSPVILPLDSGKWLVADKGGKNINDPSCTFKNIAIVDLNSGNYTLINETPISLYYHLYYTYKSLPVVHYISCSSTFDRHYIFLMKIPYYFADPNSGVFAKYIVTNFGLTTIPFRGLPARLEIFTNSGSPSPVYTLNFTLSASCCWNALEPWFIHQARRLIGNTEVNVFCGAIILYHDGNLSIYSIKDARPGVAAVSPDGAYMVIGNTVYAVAYYLNVPSIVYNGKVHVYHNAKDVYLNSSIVYNIPSGITKYGYAMFVRSGKIYIGQIYSKKRSVTLITNPTIEKGDLYKMYKMGLVKTFQYTNIAGNGIVKSQKVVEGAYPGSIDYIRIHDLKPWAPYIAEGKVGSAIDIKIPLDSPVPATQFDHILLQIAISYGTIVPVYTTSKLLCMYGVEFGVGASSAIGGYLAWKALENYGASFITDQIPSEWGDFVKYLPLGESASTILSRALPVVGAGVIVDGVAGFVMDHNTMQNTQMQTFMFVAPIFKDSSGNRYSIVTLFLPSNAKLNEWTTYTSEIMNKIGVNKYIIRVVTIGTSWKDYQNTLSKMSKEELAKKVDLLDGISALASKYGLTLSDIKLDSCHVFIATLTNGRINLWDWLSGKGLSFQVITAVNCKQISAIGTIPAQTITNPQDICNILNPLYVNGEPVYLNPENGYAVGSFKLPIKCSKVVIQSGKPYYASMDLILDAQIIAPLYNMKDGLYETNFTYSWKYCFNESKILFAAMPYKMVDSYETVYTTHGNETVNMTPYMSFITKIKDTSSPTGVRYYYGTTTPHDLRLIDPHNAGLMEPGKKYWIQYWYKSPFELGDASISVMFNGTTLASTLPRHARVIINSSKAQTVYGYLDVIVGYEDVKTHQYHTVDSHRFYFALPVGANGTSYREWDIQKYVGEAIHQFSLGRVGYVKLVGVITKAKYDNVKTNDRSSLLYIPPTSLVKPKPVVVTLKVLNSINHSPIPNASVTFDSSHYTTNATGEVSIPTISGYHTVKVSATGYHTKDTGLYAHTNETYYIYLVPSNLAIILPPVGNNTTPILPPGAPSLPWNNSTGWTVAPILYNNTTHQYYFPVEVCVQTLDGMAVSGANVSFYNTTTNTLVREDVTDATGYVVEYFPFGYNLTINVTDTAYNFSANRTVLVNRSLIVPFVIPVNSKYYEPEVAVTNVSVWIHMGLGEIPSGIGMAPVYHSVDCWFYTNKPQTITFKVWFVDLKTNKTIASKTFTAKLHVGYQKVRVFVPVNVSDFTTCQVFCEITKYEYDTNPYNNMAAGNAVTFRPWVDIYPTIVWYPIKQKTPYGLLPGDTIKVCIGVHVPKGVHLPNIRLKYSVMSHMVGKHKYADIANRVYQFTSLGQVSTVWYNYTMQIPWTNKVVISANISNAYDLAPENNNQSVVISVSPDAECIGASVQSIAVSAGSIVPVRFTIKSNYIGITGGYTIVDESNGNSTIASGYINITAPVQSFVVKVHVPPIKGKISEEHIWMVFVTIPNDVYLKDNTQEITVTIWGLPSWIVLTAIFVVVLIILLLIKHLLTIRPPREGKYFRKLDGKPPSGGLTIGGTKEGKYFRRIK